MHTSHAGNELLSCIAECSRCQQECQQTAMQHCLELGGRHVAPEHFRLMIACAEICRTTATVMMSGLPQHGIVCGVCASICDACADSCEEIGDMHECVAACRRCAESCRSMAARASTSV